MKLLTSACLAALATASSELPQEVADEIAQIPEPRKYTSIMDMAFHKLKQHPDFLPNVAASERRKTFQKMIENYGCHCFPQHKSTAGGWGKPVDEMDEACRSLYRCQKCINLEFPEQCDTIDGGYKFQLEEDLDRSIGCEAPPKTKTCASHMCSCDRAFAERVYSLWVESDWQHNPLYWLHPANVKYLQKNASPVFDRTNVCTIGGNVTPDACCGANYPNKVPYNSEQKECCSPAAKAYNPAMEVCCEDRVVSASKGCY